MISWLLSIIYDLFYICVIYRFLKSLQPLHRLIKLYVLAPLFGLQVDYSKYADKWTVITGCTDGIGKAYTEELARRGFKKFLLIGRNQQKLDDVSTILRTEHNVTTVETHIFDFSTDDWDKLPVHQLQTYDIGLLVNCVGIAFESLTKFGDQPLGYARKIIRVNAMSAVTMTDLVIRQMLARNHGIVVTISSIQGWRPLPQLCAYSASKACISFMSQSLGMEYRTTNVKFQCLVPLLVATKMSHYESDEANFLVVSPTVYARQAVDALAMYDISPGCVAHEIQIFFSLLLPFWLLQKLTVPYYKYEELRFEEVNKRRRKLEENKNS